MTFDFKALSEQAWQGQLDTKFEHHPVHSAYQGSQELQDGLLGMKGIAGIFTIDTGDGLVLLDAGTQLDVDRTFEEVRKWRPDTPLVAAIFSHHHVDHIFATKRFEEEALEKGWSQPVVYAHKLMPQHFDRYIKTRGWNTAINKRQFAINLPTFQWPDHFRYPDVTYEKQLTFTRGDLTFELHYGRGETDDHTWTYIPERKILVPGDLFIWAVPNGGNPQKVQRYVSDWADALDEMAGKGAELMIPGHGFPIFGAERVHEALTVTAGFIRDIEDQTVAMMNKGWSLDQVFHSVTFDETLMEKPYLRPVYDDPRFLIRMIWRRYGGWWDGEYDNLLPEPKARQATEWIELAGGVESVLARALQLLQNDEAALACHLVEMAYHASPDSARVHEVRAEIYQGNSALQTSSMARNILNHAALASAEGKRDLASSD
jgi:alkyl sulfatase BDS1-like metallo-beta-lactamase superfamily hydrolase